MAGRTGQPGFALTLHVVVAGQVVIGPMQGLVLEAIRNTGSISAATCQLGASYAHVWKLACLEARLSGSSSLP
jgi:molybdenum-dependent DNA-binding transcriptional regulator ModE